MRCVHSKTSEASGRMYINEHARVVREWVAGIKEQVSASGVPDGPHLYHVPRFRTNQPVFLGRRKNHL